jgi:hypothetical protein
MDGDVVAPITAEEVCGYTGDVHGYPGCLTLLARLETKIDLLVGVDGAGGRITDLESRIRKIEKLGWLLIGGGTLALTIVNLITPVKTLLSGS